MISVPIRFYNTNATRGWLWRRPRVFDTKTMKQEILQKICSCKALNGKTIFDIVSMPRFAENLAAYWTEQKETRKTAIASYKAMHKLGGPKGYKLPAHVIDKLVDLSVEDLAVEYAKVVAGCSTRNFAERKYIRQIGQQAYNLTMVQCVVDEYPELSDELLKKPTVN